MIGLTGGIASGKSTVSRYLAELGATVLDADQIAREVVALGTCGYRKVVREFPQVVTAQGIDRKKLGEIVFSNPLERKKLESIIHPLVLSRLQMDGRRYELQGKVVIADIPLLFETNSQSFLDQVWLVYVDKETQIARLMDRDNFTYEQALSRVEAQMSIEEKRKLADEIIDNRFTLTETKEQVLRLWKGICR